MRWKSVVLAIGFSFVLACDDDEDQGDDGCNREDFGAVMIELQRSAAEPSSPFVGTAKIVAFLAYEECLTNFYANGYTEYQQEGVKGAASFDAWGEGCLCDPSAYDDAIVECTVADMQQTISTQGVANAGRLRIEYAIANDGIEGLRLPLGPLPTESLAGCTPLVRLDGSSVQGFDANGNPIWKIASFDNAVAKVNQGAPIQIFVERNP